MAIFSPSAPKDLKTLSVDWIKVWLSKSSLHDCPAHSSLSLSFCLCVQDSEFNVTKSTPVDNSSSRLSSPCPGKSDPAAGEDGTKSLAGVLAALPAPPGGLKRKHSGDGPSAIFSPPFKLQRPGRRVLDFPYINLFVAACKYISTAPHEFPIFKTVCLLSLALSHTSYISYKRLLEWATQVY